jgi:hypothetical protein
VLKNLAVPSTSTSLAGITMMPTVGSGSHRLTTLRYTELPDSESRKVLN